MLNSFRFLISLLVIIAPVPVFSFDSQGSYPVAANWHSCLGCHDGTIARNIVTTNWTLFNGQIPPGFCISRGHPVGIDYGLAQLRSRGKLKAAPLLDVTVKLENGQVDCTSCHNPNSQLRAKLVMDNAGSRLCFSCHDL